MLIKVCRMCIFNASFTDMTRFKIGFWICFSFIFSAPAYAQNYSGTWKGALEIGRPLRLFFFIAKDGGKLSCMMQSPDQSPVKFPCSKIVADGDSIRIEFSNIDGHYRGGITDSLHINGRWQQNGADLTLDLEKDTARKLPVKLGLTGTGLTRHIDSVVLSEMAEQGIAGLSLGVVKDGKVIISKGYGLANVKEHIAATDKTVYKIGSLSKQFIAACILRLQEQQKLKLDDHLKKYYKDAPESWQNITIRNLLNHTSGLERESPAFNWMKKQPDSVLIRAAYKDPLQFKTGTRWEYSNLGYFMLADIIRKVSGQSFEDYMLNFFHACSMNHTTTTNRSEEPDRAVGYNSYSSPKKYEQAEDFVALRPSGAFSSNIPDLIKWDSIQRNYTILSRDDWNRMWQDTVFASKGSNGGLVYYGYGWFVRPYKKHGLVYHGGNTKGFTSEYWRITDDNLSIIILTNGNAIRADEVAKKIFKIVD